VPGSGQFVIKTGTAILNSQSAIGSSASGVASGYLATTVITSGLLVIQRGPVIEAVDLTTGRVRWSTPVPLPPPSSVPAWSHATGLQLLDYLTLTAANGLIAASVGSSWLLLDATTGRPLTPGFVSGPVQDWGGDCCQVQPENAHSLILLGRPLVEAVDPVTARVQWRVPAVNSSFIVAGNTLYAGDGVGRVVPSHLVIRIDLASGRDQGPPLLLPPALRFTGVSQSQQEPGAVLMTGTGTISRLDPVTGRVSWTRALPAGSYGAPLQPGPSGAAPSAEYLLPPHPGAGGWRILLISLATGQETVIPLGRTFPYAAAGMTSAGLAGEGFWDYYDGAMLASASASGPGGFRYTRLEGVDPRSGRVLWSGPWGGDAYVLGETFSGPPMIIVQSCSPSGLLPEQWTATDHVASCDGETLYAINA
jgi:outer membrane protein assembly factor BamB